MKMIFIDFNLEKIEINNKPVIKTKGFQPLTEREIETILSLGNGYIGTRNSLEELYLESAPGTFVAGLYTKSIKESYNYLVKIPDWTRVKIYLDGCCFDLKKQKTNFHYRYIDLSNGTVNRHWQVEDDVGRITTIKTIKYISLHDKNELGKIILIKSENYSGNFKIVNGIDCNTAGFSHLLNQNCDLKNIASVYMKSKYTNHQLIIMQKSKFSYLNNNESNYFHEYKVDNLYNGSFEYFEWKSTPGSSYKVESYLNLFVEKNEIDIVELAANKIKTFDDDYNLVHINHIKKWEERFNESKINFFSNTEIQKLVDFAIYHLICSGEFAGETNSISARSLAGESYKGHVFWDTEMFLLPFFTYTKPDIARNLLMYRYNTLKYAKLNAIKEGFKGASFAWESTDTGLEMAPEYVILPNSDKIYILSGKFENHLSADIAYAVWRYWQATEDDDFIINYGAELVFETARFSESLLKPYYDGLFHIPSVIGPDEYHEVVNDNAYTNFLVIKNFDIAYKIANFLSENHPEKYQELKEKISLTDSEVYGWQIYKEKTYISYNENTKIYEQFDGYLNLEYIDLKAYEPRSVPMDVLLGRSKTQLSQVIKQADVLMFLFLFGEEFSKEIIKANYEFYEPRTAHGSSLSPSIHSIMASRAGKPDEAFNYFIKNAKIDIGDEFGNAAGGIHIASVGGTWMSMVMGFAGMYPTDKGLIFDPYLPDKLNRFQFSIKWKRHTLKVYLQKNELELTVSGSKGIEVSAGFDNWKFLEAGKCYKSIKENNNWYWRN